MEKSVKRQTAHIIALTFGVKRIEMTSAHAFSVEDNGFVKACKPSLGTSIVTRVGTSVKVFSVERKALPVTVYIYRVGDSPTCFAGRTNGSVASIVTVYSH
ncbi:MAG: Pretoxin domain [Abditibacteriota bacterium]|nr:Pretoxin domain [Abditibacteriota bacterium]